MFGTVPHPLSGVAKGFQPPSFAKDEPRPRRRLQRTSTEPAPWLPPFQTQHPDEEKGRSIRSPTRVASVQGASLFGKAVFDGLSDEDEEERFMEAYTNDHGFSKVTAEVIQVPEHKEESAGEGDLAAQDVENDERPLSPVRNVETVDWNKVLAHAVLEGDGDIDLSNRLVARIPDSIGELSTLRKLPTLSPFSRSKWERNVQSSPSLSLSNAVPLAGQASPTARRRFARSSSGSQSSSPCASLSAASVPLKVNLANNRLERNSLPNALFGLSNLRYLFLRGNQLNPLPEGIGRLTGLVELSLCANNLEYLPAEILRLENLAVLLLHPNPFLPPPASKPSLRSVQRSQIADATETDTAESVCGETQSKKRLLGPLQTHFTVPSLKETALRTLLSQDPSTSIPQRLVQRWDGTTVRKYLAEHLFDAFHSTFMSTSLAPVQPFVPPSSGGGARRRPDSACSSTSSPCSSPSKRPGSSFSPRPSIPKQPFDPLANLCRSPLHDDSPQVFYEPAVERIEWVRESSLKPGATSSAAEALSGPGGGERDRATGSKGSVYREAKTIPIRWRGCGPRCLDWLEEEDDEEGDRDGGVEADPNAAAPTVGTP
ncbi:hypothetical protein JCM10212_003380 [Sporobolomyces blumeae]